MTATSAARQDGDAQDQPGGMQVSPGPAEPIAADVDGTTIYVRLDPGRTMAGVCGISGLAGIGPEGATR